MLDYLRPDRVLFLVIDFQSSFFNILDKNIVKLSRSNIQLVCKIFKLLGAPMLGTEHYRKGLGSTDEKVLSHWSGPAFTDKITFSCCGSDEFLTNLKENDRPTVIVSGLETHICVLQTTLDLLKRGYKVVVLKDACLSSSTLRWQNGLDIMEKAGADILNTETLIFYLLKRADSVEFKALVKMLKEQKEYLASNLDG